MSRWLLRSANSRRNRPMRKSNPLLLRLVQGKDRCAASSAGRPNWCQISRPMSIEVQEMRLPGFRELVLPLRASLFPLLLSLTTLDAARAAFPVDLALEPLPQSKHDTCQSYALAFALAAAGDAAYKADTPKALRELELRVRQHIEKVAKGRDVLSHFVWQDAVVDLTSGKYVLERREYESLAAIWDRMATLTGISDARARGSLLTAATVKVVVLTSVNKLGKNTYAGHIVPIVGVHKGPANTSSPTALAVVNPGIKFGAQPVPLCSAEVMPGDRRYTAAFSVEDSYTLKTFEAGSKHRYVAMWLQRKP